MDVTEFIKEWDRLEKKIHSGEYRNPSHVYIAVNNNEGGFILAQYYESTYGGFILFYVREDSKLIYVGRERLRNIKNMHLSL